MAAREFVCENQNVGEGPLTRVRDTLNDNSSWTDGLSPSQSAQIINPREAKTFQSESAGFLAGTGGSVTYKGLTSDFNLDFLKISWGLPYLPVDAPTLVIERARFDWDDQGSSEFQNRDPRPSSLTAQWSVSDPADENALDLLKDAPNTAIFGITGLSFMEHMRLTLSVGGTISDESLTFPNTPPPQTVSSPLKGSTVPMWLGNWVSANGDLQQPGF